MGISSRRPIIIGIVTGFLMAAGMMSGIFDAWSSFLNDRLFLSRVPDASVVIVAIDDASLMRIGRWPWKRRVQADLISRLSEAGARVIAYDVNFPESSEPSEDAALERAIKDAGNVVLPIEFATTRRAGGFVAQQNRPAVTPLPEFVSASARIGHSNAPPDADGIVRAIPARIASADQHSLTPAFAIQVAALAHPDKRYEHIPVDRFGRVLVNYAGSPKHIFPTFSAADVLDGRVEAARLRGKAIFIGATAPDLHDEQLVPTSNGVLMPGVELHASLYDTVVGQHWLRTIPWAWQGLFLVILGGLLGWCFSALRMRIAVPLVGSTFVALWILIFALFDHGWMGSPVWFVFVFVLGSVAVILERRVMIERERRHLRSAFSRYVSDSVVQSLLRDPSKLALGGEKRTMTVLFSDVRGFTTIAERLSPERLVEIMNAYLGRMTEEVFATDGVLDKYIGDAVMAFWNAPFEQRDHATRAVRTALAMQHALERMNSDQAFGDGLVLKMGVGINTGDMIVGNMGSQVRFDYTVIGDNVNLASRLEGITKEYGVGILLAESTRRAIGDAVCVRRIDKVAVKGKKEPVMIYEALAMTEFATAQDQERVRMFEEALDAYFSRQFTDTIQKAERVLRLFPDDVPSQTLVARAKHFLEQPPAEDWDGTWVFTKK